MLVKPNSFLIKLSSLIVSLTLLVPQANAFNLQIDGGGPVDEPAESVEVLFEESFENKDWWRSAIGGNFTTKGELVKVALISNGVQATHPDLVGKILPGYDTFKSEIIPVEKMVGGDYTDGLGTQIAGLIAGNLDGKGINGIYDNAMILPITIDSGKGVENSGDKGIAEGIDWAVAQGADLVVFAGGLSGAFITSKESLSCKAVKRAREGGVLTLTSSGAQYESVLDSTFSLGRCEASIKVAPVSQLLSEANGFRNTVVADIAAPSVGLTVAKGPGADWLKYEVADDAEFANGIVAGALAYLISKGFQGEALVTEMKRRAIDIGAKGVDSVFGSGFIYLGDNSSLLELEGNLKKSSAPRILSISFDENTKTSVSWVPAYGFDVESYEVIASSYIDNKWVKRVFEFPKSSVRGVIDFAIDGDSYITVKAKNTFEQRESTPNNFFKYEAYEGASNPYAKVLEVKAKWVERGILVEVSVNKEGEKESWYITQLDGWTLQPLLSKKVSAGKSYLIPYGSSSEARSNPFYILATINGERVSVGLPPEYLLTGKLLGAGDGYAAVVGESSFACNATIGVLSGCEGALVSVVDSKSKKVLGKGYVLSDLSFAVYFKVGKLAKVYLLINDKKYVVKSTTYERPFTIKKKK
jgi:hypothetical protein